MLTRWTAVAVSSARRSRRAVPALVAALVSLLPAISGGTRAQSDYPFRPGTANADLVAYYYPVPSDSVVMLSTGSTWLKGQDVRVRSIGYTQFYNQFSGNSMF